MNKKNTFIQNLITKLGAEKIENRACYNYKLKTYIGDLFLSINTEGSVISLFGNFLNDCELAQKELGHWKYNLHILKKNTNLIDIEQRIANHLRFVL